MSTPLRPRKRPDPERASRLRALQLEEDVGAVDGPSVMILAGGLAIGIFIGRGHFYPVRATSPQ